MQSYFNQCLIHLSFFKFYCSSNLIFVLAGSYKNIFYCIYLYKNIYWVKCPLCSKKWCHTSGMQDPNTAAVVGCGFLLRGWRCLYSNVNCTSTGLYTERQNDGSSKLLYSTHTSYSTCTCTVRYTLLFTSRPVGDTLLHCRQTDAVAFGYQQEKY